MKYYLVLNLTTLSICTSIHGESLVFNSFEEAMIYAHREVRVYHIVEIDKRNYIY